MNGSALALGAVGALALGVLVRRKAGSAVQIEMEMLEPYLTNGVLDELVKLGDLLHAKPTSAQRKAALMRMSKMSMEAGFLLDALTSAGIPWASAWDVWVLPFARTPRSPRQALDQRMLWVRARSGREGWIRDAVESAEQALKDFDPYAMGGERIRFRQRLDHVIAGDHVRVRAALLAEYGRIDDLDMDTWIRYSSSHDVFAMGTAYAHARDAINSAMNALIRDDLAAVYHFAGNAAAQVRMRASQDWREGARTRCQKRLLLRALIAYELVGEDG